MRVRSGDEDVGWAPDHQPTLPGRGVSRAHSHTNLGKSEPFGPSQLHDCLQRFLEVLFNVVSKGLKRGDINDAGSILEVARLGAFDEPVDGPQKRRKGFS